MTIRLEFTKISGDPVSHPVVQWQRRANPRTRPGVRKREDWARVYKQKPLGNRLGVLLTVNRAPNRGDI